MKMLGDQGGNADKSSDDQIPHKKLGERMEFDSTELKKFPWETSWLTGEQYLQMIQKMDLYSQRYGFRKFPSKTHPEQIYTQPQNGTIYFVEGSSIGSQFGFPRNNMKKKYRWKKMNFKTNLPKKNPVVTYIVSSAVKCERLTSLPPSEPSLFRMHVVIPFRGRACHPSFVLCHIRQLDNFNHSNKVSSSDQIVVSRMLEVERQSLSEVLFQPVNYFTLFRIVHNLNKAIEESDPKTFFQ